MPSKWRKKRACDCVICYTEKWDDAMPATARGSAPKAVVDIRNKMSICGVRATDINMKVMNPVTFVEETEV